MIDNMARHSPPAIPRPPLPAIRLVPPPIAVQPIIERMDAEIIIAGIDNLASAISASWFDLSPEAQARALELEATLSFLRRQLA